MQAVDEIPRLLLNGSLPLFLLFLLTLPTLGQSTEATAPSPISSRDLSGSIAARDLGDARFTHHYYAFGGNPGDVLITVQSRNLNGDVDIFTAGTLRPLLKFTLYAESTSPITKGIFLRRHEDLILRVEARTPNDDEGIYQIRFGGTFEARAAPLVAEGEKTEPTVDLAARPKGRRVNSAGARINEPPPPPEEVAVVTPIAGPTPAPSPSPEASPAAPEESPAARPARPTPSRRDRARPGTRRTTPRPEPTATAEKTETTTPADVKEPGETAKAAEPEPIPARPARRGTGRRTARASAPPPAAAEPEPPSGPRLVIEMLDGTSAERYMSTIKRVTIENNQIVVIGKDGKIDRTRLSDVARMTIAP